MALGLLCQSSNKELQTCFPWTFLILCPRHRWGVSRQPICTASSLPVADKPGGSADGRKSGKTVRFEAVALFVQTQAPCSLLPSSCCPGTAVPAVCPAAGPQSSPPQPWPALGFRYGGRLVEASRGDPAHSHETSVEAPRERSPVLFACGSTWPGTGRLWVLCLLQSALSPLT